ncbi:MAG: ABC transporter permease, partial [Spirochaetales bacterium]|nr:ABC transporter permease [Spirochaetales bacterium]
MITSILVRTIVAGTPLLLGTLGEVTTERSGIMNLGVEGMMSVGAVTGFIVTFSTGNPWLGMLAATGAGALFSLLHGFVTISLRANQVVSGLSLTMLGLGLSGLWGKTFIGRPLEVRMAPVAIPLLS